MQTRRSPDQSNNSNSDDGKADGVPSTSGPGAVQWTVGEEEILIDFLVTHKAEAGDGLNFKASFWTAAAEHMQPHTKKGGKKTADKCRSKWNRVSLKAYLQTHLIYHSIASSFIPNCQSPQVAIWLVME
jgi:Myb/SANT-like DNA-binding domain